MACTAIAITREGARAAGQNMDLPAWTNTLQTVLNVTDQHGLRTVAATYPGSLATCGTNSNGVVVVVNALDLATDLSGVPVDFVTRGALSCPSAQAAIDFIKSIPHAVGQTYTVIDEHDLFMVEAAADGVIDVPLNDDVSWHTNHALTRDHDVSVSSITRWDAVADRVSHIKSAQDIMETLANKESGICQVQGHFGEDMYSFMGIVGDCLSKRTWVNVSPATGSGFIEIV
jgi:predicted choloylglycine hydrolase